MNNIVNPYFRQVAFESEEKIYYKTEKKGILQLFYSGENQIIRAKLSAILQQLLESSGIKTYFVKEVSLREHEVFALDLFPFIFNVSSFVSTKLAKEFMLQEGMKLKNPLLEIYLANNTLITKEHIVNFDWMKKENYEELEYNCKRIMDLLTGFFKAINITIFNLKMQFGKKYKKNGTEFEILFADELSAKNISLQCNDNLELSDETLSIEIAKRLGILQR